MLCDYQNLAQTVHFGAIPTCWNLRYNEHKQLSVPRFGITVLTSLYSCNFLYKLIETKFLPISSTAIFAWRARFCTVCLEFLFVQLNLWTFAGLFRLLKSAVVPLLAYSWSLEDWYCCVRNRVLHTLVLVSVVCALLFLSYKQNKKVRPARLFRWSRLPAQSVFLCTCHLTELYVWLLHWVIVRVLVL